MEKGGNHHDHPVRLTAAITHEGPWYVARCLEVDVTSEGPSLDQALITCGKPWNCILGIRIP